MDDSWEILELPHSRLEPSAEFRRRLLRELDAEIRDAGATAQTNVEPRAVLQMTLTSPQKGGPVRDRRPHRYFTLFVAAAGAIVALTGLVVARDRDAGPLPLNEQPTTIPFDPIRDAAIAKSMLLDPADYAPGWTDFPFKEVLLDHTVADEVPGCAGFVDTVFEGPLRPAVTDYRHFLFYPLAITAQYVVVFPTDAAAQAMFDATVDPGFRHQCLQPYYALTGDSDGWCCDTSEPATPPLFGESVESAAGLGADDVDVRVVDDAYWTDETGVVHGPERRQSVTLRVGRAVIAFDALMRRESGEALISEDQFDSAVSTAIDQAREALDRPAD